MNMLMFSPSHVRSGVLVLGGLSLNLTECSRKDLLNITTLLSLLMPSSVCESLTLSNLNNKTYIPAQTADGELEGGLLQLPVGTTLILDEMALEPGELRQKGWFPFFMSLAQYWLNCSGTANAQALQSIIATQSLSYPTAYGAIDFQTDIKVLGISDCKSMLPVSNSQIGESRELILCSISIIWNSSLKIIRAWISRNLRSARCGTILLPLPGVLILSVHLLQKYDRSSLLNLIRWLGI